MYEIKNHSSKLGFAAQTNQQKNRTKKGSEFGFESPRWV